MRSRSPRPTTAACQPARSSRKSELSLATSAGLGLFLEGVPISTPDSVAGVEGFKRELTAPNSAVAADGTALQFAGWSDGKSVRHPITTPNDDITYAATHKTVKTIYRRVLRQHGVLRSPGLTRQDANINFVGAPARPDPAVPSTVLRFAGKTLWFDAGRYKFTTAADDGVRLYVDGKRVIGQ